MANNLNLFNRNFYYNLHNRTMRKKEDNGFSISPLCWLCLIDYSYKRVRFLFKNLFLQFIKILSFFRRILLTLILFLGRGVIAGLFQAAYVYTPEVYPTNLRSIGVGGCSSLARLGAMCTPYVAQVLFQASVGQAVAVYSAFALCASVACIFLPYETRGNDLTQ